MFHEHPLRILRYSIKNLWILIFPFFRNISIYSNDLYRLESYKSGIWFDIITFAVIIIFGFIQWYFSVITVNEEMITYKEGIMFKKQKTIPYKNVSALTVEIPFFLLPFKAEKIYINTCSYKKRNSDVSLMLSSKNGDVIKNQLINTDLDKIILAKKQTKMISIFLFSVFFSSSFSGALYISAIFFRGGSFLKDLISKPIMRISEETSRITDEFIVKIPFAVIAIGVFFILAWFLSFIINFVRYIGFEVKSDKNNIEVSYGFITRYKYIMKISSVNYSEYRQNMIMKLFNIVAVNVDCSGYGIKGKDFPLLIPIKKDKSYLFSENEFIAYPSKRSLWQYVWKPLTGIIIIGITVFISKKFLLSYSEIVYFVLVILEIPLVWLVIIKITDLFTSAVIYREKNIIIKYSKGYHFFTIKAEQKKIVKISISQTPFQRFRNKCNIEFYISGKRIRRHVVKSIDQNKAMELKRVLDKK